MPRYSPFLALLALLLLLLGCQNDRSSPTAPAPEVVAGAAVVQAQPYCYGSWRGAMPPYSHYTDLRLGGVLAPGSTSAWINECKLRIKASTQWQSTICVGLVGNWTVQTHIGVRQCFNPDDFTTCAPEIGSGFSTQCQNGVPQG